MAAILFVAETVFLIFKKVENPTYRFILGDPYCLHKKMIRFDLYFKMAAVGAPGPHGSWFKERSEESFLTGVVRYSSVSYDFLPNPISIFLAIENSRNQPQETQNGRFHRNIVKT